MEWSCSGKRQEVKLTPDQIEVYELAHRLNCFVCDIETRMSYDEMKGWFEYFKIRPYGWREDNRAGMIIAHGGFGSKVKPDHIFPSLQAIRASYEDIPLEQRLARSFKDSGLFAKFKNIAKSNNIEWEVDDGSKV